MSKIFLLSFLLFFTSNLLALDKKTVAKSLVIKASKYAKKVGKKRAIAEFNNPKGRFTKGEFYVFAISMKGEVLANYSQEKLRWLKNYKNKKHFIDKFINALKKHKYTWVSYYWKHPIKNRLMKKNSFIITIDKSYFIGCGFYHNRKSK